MKDSRSAPFDS